MSCFRPLLLIALVAVGALRGFAATDQEAAAAKQAGDFPRAIALYQELLAANPDNVGYLLQLGTVQGWAGRYDEALATLERALALAPADTDLRMARGRVLAWSGQHGRAEAIFREILATEPADLEAQNMLGRVQLWTRQFDAAERTFDAILAAAPENTDALVARGDIEKLQGRPDAARGFYERAAAFAPASVEIQHRLTGVRRLGRWRLDAGWERSAFDGDSREDWTDWRATLRYALDRKTGLSLGLERADRFGVLDTAYTAGADRRFTDNLSATARLTLTPDADFLPVRAVDLGAVWRMRVGDRSMPGTLLLADYRAATYGPGTVHLAWYGITQYTPFRVAVTLKGLAARNLNARWTGAWQFRLDGEPADAWRWHLAYADGKESLASTVFDFLAERRTRAVFGGLQYEFSPAFGLRLDLTHEWAAGLPDRNAFHAGFTTRF